MAKQLVITVPDDYNFEHVNIAGLLQAGHDFDVINLTPRPHSKGKANRPGNLTRTRADVTVSGSIMQKFTPQGAFTKRLAQDWIMQKGYCATSVGPAISNLISGGYIERFANDKDRYRFLKPLPEGKRDPRSQSGHIEVRKAG